MRLIYKISKEVKVGRDSVSSKNKVNALVTTSHIVVTVAYAATQASLVFTQNDLVNTRMYTSFEFFGGLADLFLSIMLWFIFDTEQSASVYLDGDRAYAIEDVIKEGQSAINEDCDEEE